MDQRTSAPFPTPGSSTVLHEESRCKRFARSFRSMNPRNFGDASNVKFLKSRKQPRLDCKRTMSVNREGLRLKAAQACHFAMTQSNRNGSPATS